MLPLYLIRNRWEPGGGYLPKREEWKAPFVAARALPAHYQGSNYTPIHGMGSRIQSTDNSDWRPLVTRIIQEQTEKKQKFHCPHNLPLNEYIFWSGSMIPTSGFARCRFCFEWTYTPQRREIHQVMGLASEFRLDGSCARRCQLAWKELMKKGACVVCAVITRKSHWGVPLCSPECEQQWMTVDGDFPAVTAVLGTTFSRVKMRLFVSEAEKDMALRMVPR